MAEAMIKCENCGAENDVHEPRCSYCGAFLYPGAEKEYWEKLHQVHEDLKDLDDVPEEVFEQEVKSHVRKISTWLRNGLILLAVCAGAWMAFTSYREKKETEEWKEQLMWQQENFPKLDTWYEAGDYDAILEFQNQLYQEDSPYHIWNWEHAAFLNCYEAYRYCREFQNVLMSDKNFRNGSSSQEKMLDGPLSQKEWEENSVEMLYWLMDLKCRTVPEHKASYSDEEWKLVQEYQDETWKAACIFLEMEASELQLLWEELCPNGLASHEKCQEYVNKIMKEIGR